jgi:hypothetical protein
MIELMGYVRDTGEVRLRFGKLELGDPAEATIKTTIEELQDLYKRLAQWDSRVIS